MGVVTFEDTGIAEEIEADDIAALPSDCWDLWTITQDDTAPMEERDEAAAQLVKMAEDGDSDVQYLTGKLFRDGPVLIPDSVEAQYWFSQAAQELPAAQYALGTLLLSDDPEVRDSKLGIQWLEYAAHSGNDYAAYRRGKEYLKGEVMKKDIVKAADFLTQAAEAENQYAHRGNEYAQFFLDRWNSLRAPSVMLSVTRLLHHMSRVFQEQVPTPSVPGGVQIDRKRMQKLREKKIAMGHKPDDHEEQPQDWKMTMG